MEFWVPCSNLILAEIKFKLSFGLNFKSRNKFNRYLIGLGTNLIFNDPIKFNIKFETLSYIYIINIILIKSIRGEIVKRGE